MGARDTKEFKEKKLNDFRERLLKEVGDEFTLTDIKPIPNNTHWFLHVTHNKCGSNLEVRDYNFFGRKTRCSECRKMSLDEFKKRVKEKHGGEYSVVSTTMPSNTKGHIRIRHNCKDCDNYEWDANLGSFLHKNNKCPACSKKLAGRNKAVKSKGEKLVEYYCKTNDIAYQSQKCFGDCKRKSLLLFDFLIDNFLIEIDGRQHFDSCTDSKYSSEAMKESDVIKTKYCLDNSLNFLRIPYTELDNLFTILDTVLKQYDYRELYQYDILLLDFVNGRAILNEDGLYSNIITQTNESQSH